MKIGIDLDGVVIDSETTFRTYEEIFDIDFLKGNNYQDASYEVFYELYIEDIEKGIRECGR